MRSREGATPSTPCPPLQVLLSPESSILSYMIIFFFVLSTYPQSAFLISSTAYLFFNFCTYFVPILLLFYSYFTPILLLFYFYFTPILLLFRYFFSPILQLFYSYSTPTPISQAHLRVCTARAPPSPLLSPEEDFQTFQALRTCPICPFILQII